MSGGIDAEPLLTLERLRAVLIPALIELALVLVCPLLGDVVRGVRAPGRVVHEPRLLGILRADRMQPRDRLVGQVIREVVRLAVGARGTPTMVLSLVIIGSYWPAAPLRNPQQ